MFPPPEGQISIGVCKHCGEEQEAVNYSETRRAYGHAMKKNPSKAEKQRPHTSEEGEDEALFGRI